MCVLCSPFTNMLLYVLLISSFLIVLRTSLGGGRRHAESARRNVYEGFPPSHHERAVPVCDLPLPHVPSSGA